MALGHSGSVLRFRSDLQICIPILWTLVQRLHTQVFYLGLANLNFDAVIGVAGKHVNSIKVSG